MDRPLTKTLIPLLALVALAQQSPVTPAMVRSDTALIAPGMGAEGVLLGDTQKELAALSFSADKEASFDEPKDLFADIYGESVNLKIPYSKIYYYETRRFVVFMNRDAVTAIAGMNTGRVTADSVGLENGMQHFMFNYGNEGLAIVTKNPHRLLIYRSLGIAVADDEGDGTIDMYIVFPPAAR